MMPPRPLIGEPLALDLINTAWVDGAETYDLLASKQGTRAWLKEWELSHDPALLPEIQRYLQDTRSVLRQVLEAPHQPENRDAINQILSHGRTRHMLGSDGPEDQIEVSAAWNPAWRAASNLLELLRSDPTRLKKCGNPACVLYFLDTSPKNARHWHDMRTCGNRAKAARHYQKTRG
jgi:predicted RNA-binding Zn ribbon-like protein